MNVIGAVNQLGYGIATLNILKAAYEENLDISLIPIGHPQDVPNDCVEVVQNGLAKGRMFDRLAPSIRIWHQFDLSLHCGEPRVGFPFFELDEFTSLEKHHLNNQDVLFVASQWAKNVIASNGITIPTKVVPLGVDRSIFNVDTSVPTAKDTVFFNVGKWEIRKGHDVIIEAFEKAFSPTDDVRLVMVCNNPFLQQYEQEEWESRYVNGKLGGKVNIIKQRFRTQKELARLMNSCDIGVFPARAEGWNLDLIEAMSCGKHVITTNSTAHTEFCTTENASLIETPELEWAYDGKWFLDKDKSPTNQGHWHVIGDKQIDEIAQCMLEYHKIKQSGKLTVNTKGIETATKFSWGNTVRTMWNHLNG